MIHDPLKRQGEQKSLLGVDFIVYFVFDNAQLKSMPVCNMGPSELLAGINKGFLKKKRTDRKKKARELSLQEEVEQMRLEETSDAILSPGAGSSNIAQSESVEPSEIASVKKETASPTPSPKSAAGVKLSGSQEPTEQLAPSLPMQEPLKPTPLLPEELS